MSAYDDDDEPPMRPLGWRGWLIATAAVVAAIAIEIIIWR